MIVAMPADPQPPLDSWWALQELQRDRAAFLARAESELPRMRLARMSWPIDREPMVRERRRTSAWDEQ